MITITGFQTTKILKIAQKMIIFYILSFISQAPSNKMMIMAVIATNCFHSLVFMISYDLLK